MIGYVGSIQENLVEYYDVKYKNVKVHKKQETNPDASEVDFTRKSNRQNLSIGCEEKRAMHVIVKQREVCGSADG